MSFFLQLRVYGEQHYVETLTRMESHPKEKKTHLLTLVDTVVDVAIPAGLKSDSAKGPRRSLKPHKSSK